MVIDKDLLDRLTEQAKQSTRLRMNYDLRNSTEDSSQRMLNAMEPGTSLQIHRHNDSSETVIVIRGRGLWHYYDDCGKRICTYDLSSDGVIRGLCVPKGQWHNSEIIESGTVIITCKDGAYKQLSGTEIFSLK